MNPKIALDELKEMTYDEYVKNLKKEIKRASLEGRTDFLVLSDFMFKGEQEPHVALIFGKFTGKMARFYKRQIKERAGTKDFARGSAYFEEKGDGSFTIHLNKQGGKAKDAKIKKNGKKMFNKLGLDIQWEELEIDLDEVQVDEIISEREEEETVGAAEELSENKNMRRIHKDYLNYFAQVSEVIIPKIKNNETISKDDFEQAKQLHILSKAYVKEYNTMSEKAQNKYTPTLEKVKANTPLVEKIFAKLKQMGMAQNSEQDDTLQIVDENLYTSIQNIVNNLSELNTFYTQIENAIAIHEKEPLIASKAPSLIANMQTQIKDLQIKIETIQSSSPAKYDEFTKQVQTLNTQLNTANQITIDFEIQRAKKLQEIKEAEEKRKLQEAAKQAFNQSWSDIFNLRETCSKIIAEKKNTKEVFKYEHKILCELKDALLAIIKQLDSYAQHIQSVLITERSKVEDILKKVTSFINICTIASEVTKKDEYFNSYTQINQSSDIGKWSNTVTWLDSFMNKDKPMSANFAKKVSLNVDHIQQAPNSKECKDISQLMVKNFAIKNGLNPNDFIVKDFGGKGTKFDPSAYIPIAKENKSKVSNIIQKEGERYESLEHNALDVQKTAEQAYQYIHDLLDAGKPVVVGVDHTYNRILTGHKKSTKSAANGGYNNDETTDHFIVIVGKGIEGNIPYFEYVDPATKNGAKGQNNRLYPVWQGGNQYWYDAESYKPRNSTMLSYCLTSVCKYA